MRRQRQLLTLGNQKLGDFIGIWSLPAVTTCPGATASCRAVCYADAGRYKFSSVRRRLKWNWTQSRRDDFEERMLREVRERGVITLRLHGSGDFYDREYAQKWLRILQRASRPRFFAYTRSWSIADIAPVLEEMAKLSCMRLWYSCDATGLPARVPPGVRLAYLQTDQGPVPPNADLVFRTRKLRKLPALPVVCSSETPHGKRTGVTCGSCARCFQ